MDENFELLQDAIKQEFERLNKEDLTDEERKALINDLRELYSLKLKELEIRNNYEVKDDDNTIKAKQIDQQKNDLKLKLIQWGVSTGLSTLFLIGAFSFEKTGTFTSWITKWFFQKNVKIN